MAKNNNLTDFLTDVADAIREKKGTTDPINPQDFSAEIASISSGAEAKPLKDVNFFDYDGTILHSFTAAEFLALSAMPALPTQEGLICQEWNWTYEAAREYVEEFGLCDIGATYITDDGKTRIYIHVVEGGRKNISLRFKQSISKGVTFDWGDGSSPETKSGTSTIFIEHTYANGGDYCITLNPQDNCILILGDGSNYSLYSNGVSIIRSINIGKNVNTLSKYSLCRIESLQSITIPNEVTEIGSQALSECYNLRCLILPSSMITLSIAAMLDCYGLEYVSFNNGLKTISTSLEGSCRLKRAILPKSVTQLESAFARSKSLQVATLPTAISSLYKVQFTESNILFIKIGEGVKDISYRAFYNCKHLQYVVFPSTIKTIQSQAFYGTGALFFDFSKAKQVPTIDTDVFVDSYSGYNIIVPDELYDSWITATNWSDITYRIVKASEYNG